MREARPEHPEQWSRLSARMLLVHPVKEFAGFLPAIVGAFVVGRTTSGAGWWWGVLAVALPLLGGVLTWLTTTFRVTPELVQVRRGVFQRRTLTAALDRVRTVDVVASPLHRLLGLATVRIGTGAQEPFVLDGLPAADARRLRDRLLHHAGRGDATLAASDAPAASEEEVLAAFSPSWVRFAPLTGSGFLALLAVFAVGFRLVDDVLGQGQLIDAGSAAVEGGVPPVATAALGVLAFLALAALASVVVYVLATWGFRLTRSRRATLHIARGLLTTRAVSIDEARVRGVELVEPLLVRLAGGARAELLTAGAAGDHGRGSDLLMPLAPSDVVERAAADVIGDPAPWQVELVRHGPAAMRRRIVRAVLAVLPVPLAVAAAWWRWEWPLAVLAAALLPVLLAVLVGSANARNLGHALLPGTLVAREGTLPRRRYALLLPGIIGWTWNSTYFQRRLGLVTLEAMTAAGSGAVRLLDVPETVAAALVRRADPALIGPFLAEATTPALGVAETARVR